MLGSRRGVKMTLISRSGHQVLRRLNDYNLPTNDTSFPSAVARELSRGSTRMKRIFRLRNMAFLLLGWIGSFILGTFLAANNVTGPRGPPLRHNPLHTNRKHADITAVGILDFLAIFASIRWPRIRAAAT